MIIYENNCYNCPRPCSGSCHRSHMEVHICDECCDKHADYIVDGEEFCTDCLIERVKEDLDAWKRSVENDPDLNLWDAAYMLYDHVEEVK